MKRILMGISMSVLASLLLILILELMGMRFTPHCQEDQVLLGVGDFNKGRWSSYECGPAADDFAPFSDIQLQACGDGWYHTLNALDEALIRLDREQ